MGEAEFEQKTLVKAVDSALVELAEQATAMILNSSVTRPR